MHTHSTQCTRIQHSAHAFNTQCTRIQHSAHAFNTECTRIQRSAHAFNAVHTHSTQCTRIQHSAHAFNTVHTHLTQCTRIQHSTHAFNTVHTHSTQCTRIQHSARTLLAQKVVRQCCVFETLHQSHFMKLQHYIDLVAHKHLSSDLSHSSRSYTSVHFAHFIFLRQTPLIHCICSTTTKTTPLGLCLTFCSFMPPCSMLPYPTRQQQHTHMSLLHHRPVYLVVDLVVSWLSNLP